MTGLCGHLQGLRSMRRRLRQNDTNIFRNLYQTSNIYISDVRYLYLMSNIQYLTSARAGISDVLNIYRTSDLDMGRRI